MNQRLFVYGTLAPGRANARLLDGLAGEWQSATVNGSLHPQGWGATHGYPAVRLNPNGMLVPGWIFSSNELQSHWTRLDAFEGDRYQRVLTQATLKNGDRVEVYIYQLHSSVTVG